MDSKRLRRDALNAWRAGVAAAAPARRVEAALGDRTDIRHNLADTFVLATGKAATAMARGVGPGARGIAIVPRASDVADVPPGIRILFADHPNPSRAGFDASRDALARVEALGERERLLYLVSGGTSALFEVPCDSVPDEDVIATYELLVTSGLSIDRINVVRRALSAVKGGGLALAAYPAKVTTFAVSDVEGDVAAAIGSGPTVFADDRPGDALEILREAGLADAIPESVATELGRPRRARPRKARLDGFEIVASVSQAEDGAAQQLEAAGYRCLAPPVQRLSGDAGEAAWNLVDSIAKNAGIAPDSAFVIGGETTVRVPSGAGCGGRNQHMAAILASALHETSGFACMVGGTDGIDGNSSAAGALIDGRSAARAAAAGHDLPQALVAFDTGAAFAASGDAIVTGPNGTNVGDLLVAVFGNR